MGIDACSRSTRSSRSQTPSRRRIPPPMSASATAAKKPAADSANGNAPEIPKPQDDRTTSPSDGFLVNGSVNNAATSKFSLDQAFGNRRPNSKSLYNGGLAAIFDNSALDARPTRSAGEPPKPLQSRHRRLYFRRAAQDSAPAAARAEFLRRLTSGRATKSPRPRPASCPLRRSGRAIFPA